MESNQKEVEDSLEYSIPPYNRYVTIWFVVKRFVVAPVDFALSIATVIDQYSSCTTYFIAASNSLIPTREILFPLSIFAAGICLMFRWMSFRNIFKKYKQLATENGLITLAETGPYFEVMFDMKDKSPVGVFQKHLTIINLFGQHFIQIFLAYYVIYISQIDFTWLSSFRVFLSTIISCYTFAQLFTLRVKKYSRAMHIVVFFLFLTISFVMAFIIPRSFVVYPNEIDVNQLQIATQNQVCYSLGSNSVWSPTSNCTTAPSCTFSLDMSPLTKNQIHTAPSAVSNYFYYSTIPPTSTQNSTKLVFQSMRYQGSGLCGNPSLVNPSNFWIAAIDSTSPSNRITPTKWQSLDSYLISTHEQDYQGIFYATFENSLSNTTNAVTGNIRLTSKTVCTIE